MNTLFLLLICIPASWPTSMERPDPQQMIFDEVSWTVKLLLLREHGEPTTEGTRRFKRQAADYDHTPPHVADDNDMKMKLFRLMYETVRDSDLKVKRAELINSYYANSSGFEVGYLLGDVTDKFNIMSDISSTLKRLYDSWKPIEHINAYEQIANQAIEISHLIDIVRSVSKRDEPKNNENDKDKDDKRSN